MGRKRLSAGHLRHAITIQSETLTPDGRGGATRAWATYVTAWANVSPFESVEGFAAGQLQGSITHRVTLRYQSGIRPKMRVLWGSRVFEITGVRTIEEERRVVVLDCVEERT